MLNSAVLIQTPFVCCCHGSQSTCVSVFNGRGDTLVLKIAADSNKKKKVSADGPAPRRPGDGSGTSYSTLPKKKKKKKHTTARRHFCCDTAAGVVVQRPGPDTYMGKTRGNEALSIPTVWLGEALDELPLVCESDEVCVCVKSVVVLHHIVL